MPDSNKPVHPADLKRLKVRGKGIGKEYEPFIFIHEISSRGESCRSNSATVGRVHHLLSRVELAAFLFFDQSSDTIDIREQFPIPIEDSLDISRQLGIKHPQISGKLKVVTTDFLFDFKSKRPLALAVKYADELSDSRVIEKLQIEKVYWENKGSDWNIFTERQVDSGLKENLQWIHPTLVNDTGERTDLELIAVVERILAYKNEKIGSLCSRLDDSYQVDPGFHMETFRLAVARKMITAPLKQSFYLWTTKELSIPVAFHALRGINVS